MDKAYYRKIYETPKMQDLWNTISYIESAPNQTVSLSVMGGVSDWMGGSQVLPDKEDYWVRMIASLLDYGRNEKHLRLTLISPLNEADWDGIEGPKVGAVQMTDLLHKLSRRLDSMGMDDVQFVTPDTASVTAAHDAYVPALAADPVVASKIARFGIHTYSGDAGGVPALVDQGRRADAGVWATEFNAPCSDCDSGTGQANSWDHALAMARDELSLFRQGVAGAQLYDAWDGFYEHHQAVGHWGALELDPSSGTYRARRSFDVLALTRSAIADGNVRVDTNGAENLYPVAFLGASGRDVVALGANPGPSPRLISMKLDGGTAFSQPQILFTRDGTAGISAGTAFLQGSSVLAEVPANSVFAIRAALR
jgi:hypothetical protein